MRSRDAFLLVALAAIWGFSFLFMRVVAPVLGASLTASLRLLLAGGVLSAWLLSARLSLGWREYWRHFFFIGFFGATIPFLCFTFSARHIPASYSAILNATSPLFAAVISALWAGTRFTARTAAGLALGIGGVALVAQGKPQVTDSYYAASIGACLLASIGYAVSGVYVRKYASHVPPRLIAAGNQLIAGIFILPLLPWNSVNGPITPLVAGDMLGLAILCSAIAYLIYYRLVADVGPTRALTVTFLVPAFGMLWAWLFLGEAVTIPMLAGCALVVAGTWGISRNPA